MIKKKYSLFLLLTLLIVGVVIIFNFSASKKKPQTGKSFRNAHALGQLKIGDKKLQVEIMKNQEEKAQGLSGRKDLEPDHGMLFDFSTDKDAIPSFWMKDMLFPIDIIWIKNSRIIFIHKDVPAPKNKSSNLEIYTPPSSVDYVLEVNSGWSEKNYIQTGDPVEITY